MIALMAAEMIMIIQMLAVKTVATGVRLWCQWSWCETVHSGMERKLCHGLRVLLSSRWNVVAVDVCYIGCFPCPVMAHGLVHVIPIVANNSCCKGIYSFIQSIEWLSLFFLPSLLGFLFTHLPSWTSDDGTSSDIEYISLWRDGWMDGWILYASRLVNDPISRRENSAHNHQHNPLCTVQPVISVSSEQLCSSSQPRRRPTVVSPSLHCNPRLFES